MPDRIHYTPDFASTLAERLGEFVDDLADMYPDSSAASPVNLETSFTAATVNLR